MRQKLISIAMVVAAIVAGGATAYTVSYLKPESAEIPLPDSTKAFAPEAGAQFTSYSESNYPDLTYAAENAVRAVVGIDIVQRIPISQRSQQYNPFYDLFGIPQQQGGSPKYREQRGGGSGVIISEDGYIITNNHVIDGASSLRVKLYDGGTYDAELIGTDPASDIALIKIDKSGLPTLPFGSSDDLRLGEWVLAIGSPFDLQSTITAGIVSAKARQLDAIPNEFRIESFIQTDAAVNPGNSGGALVNARGELVGINTLIKSQTGSYVGYSFAVPESIVRKVATDIREFGVVQRAMLGVQYVVVTDDFIESQGEELGIDEAGGAYIASIVEGGAASRAGIRKGDIITAIGGVELGTKVNMQEIVAKYRPGDKIKLSVKRGDKMKQFVVTLRNNSGTAELLSQDQVDMVNVLGAKLVEASAKLCRELEIDGGVQVQSIEEGGLLSIEGVRRDFVITHINDKRVTSLKELQQMGDNITSIDGVYPDGRSASYHFRR